MSVCLRYVYLLWLVGDRAQGEKSDEEHKVEELSGGYGKSLLFKNIQKPDPTGAAFQQTTVSISLERADG